MQDDYKTYVPQTLDDPPKFLFWDFDVALLFILVLGIGIMVGALITSVIAGGTLAWLFSRAKSGRSRGYGIHLMYWYLPIGIGFKRVPPSKTRHFVG
jgi:conjugal transfer pilus assembly protein TraL